MIVLTHNDVKSESDAQSIYICRLAKYLKSKGHQVLIYCTTSNNRYSTTEGFLQRFCHKEGIAVETRMSIGLTQLEIYRFSRYVIANNYRIVIANNTLYALYAGASLERIGIKTIPIYHAVDNPTMDLVRTFSSKGSPFKLSKSVVVCHELLEKLNMISQFSVDSHLISTAVDTYQFTRTTSNQRKSIISACYVGRLENDQKNIIELSKLVDFWIENNLIELFSFYGCGQYLNWLKEKYKNNNLVNVYGPIKNENLPFVYQSNTFIVLNSSFEGTPTVILESMACGCIPIVRDCPGDLRVLVDSSRGHISKQLLKTSGAFIRELTKDVRNIEQMSSRCHRFINENYSVDRQFSKWLNLLNFDKREYKKTDCEKVRIKYIEKKYRVGEGRYVENSIIGKFIISLYMFRNLFRRLM